MEIVLEFFVLVEFVDVEFGLRVIFELLISCILFVWVELGFMVFGCWIWDVLEDDLCCLGRLGWLVVLVLERFVDIGVVGKIFDVEINEVVLSCGGKVGNWVERNLFLELVMYLIIFKVVMMLRIVLVFNIIRKNMRFLMWEY